LFKAMRSTRVLKRLIIALGALAAILCGVAHLVVERAARGLVFDAVHRCPEAPVAVVLGVGHNRNYRPRVSTAAELFLKGKVRALIVSGDNSRESYNEPARMRADLISMGVPEQFVTCDYAGLRTLDSVIRADRVFGQRRFLVVSQRYHCERAIFLARHLGLEVCGVATTSDEGYASAQDHAREILARVRAVADAYLGVQPKYLGPPVHVALFRLPPK
jgi:SanA protein